MPLLPVLTVNRKLFLIALTISKCFHEAPTFIALAIFLHKKLLNIVSSNMICISFNSCQNWNEPATCFADFVRMMQVLHMCRKGNYTLRHHHALTTRRHWVFARTKIFVESSGCRTHPLETNGCRPRLPLRGTKWTRIQVRTWWYRYDNMIDSSCFSYFLRNSLVALLEALFARIFFFRFEISVCWIFFLKQWWCCSFLRYELSAVYSSYKHSKVVVYSRYTSSARKISIED